MSSVWTVARNFRHRYLIFQVWGSVDGVARDLTDTLDFNPVPR